MGKVPLIKWRDRSGEVTRQDIISWKKEFKAFNIGIPLGGISGYIGIDIDGAEGEQILKKLRGPGELPETWEFNTGAGRRLLYTIPEGMQTKKSVNTGAGVHEECSILAEGQVTVIPPSVHHTGKRYEWVFGKSPDAIDCAPAPGWLLDLVRADKPEPLIRAQKEIEKVKSEQKQKTSPSNADVASVFAVSAFSDEIPDDLDDVPEVQVKRSKDTGKKSKGKKVKVLTQSWRDMMQYKVSEGGRDNAITQFIGSLLADPTLRAAGKSVIQLMALQYNNENLDPPLEESEVLPKIEVFWENEAAKSASFGDGAEAEEIYYEKLMQPIHNKLDALHLTYIYDPTIKMFYYHWDDVDNIDTWIPDKDGGKLGRIIRDIVKDPPFSNPSWISPSRLQATIDLFALELQDVQEELGLPRMNLFAEAEQSEFMLYHLPVKGKLVNWETGQIIPWDRRFLSEINFQVDYDPDAKCPHWEQYMRDWLPDEQSRKLLQQFAGQALLSRSDIEDKFIILYGSGSNGKSIFLKTLERIVGPKAFGTASLHKLTERFGAAAIYQKRMNVCTELADKYIKDTSKLKELVAGDEGEIEMKGKDSFNYRPVCSFIFATNTLPKIGDDTTGWTRRQLIVPFNQYFKADANIKMEMDQNIAQELPGIFNWLLQGIRDRNGQAHYPQSAIIDEANIQAQKEQNDIKKFCEMFIKETDAGVLRNRYGKTKHGLSVQFLHALYVAWYNFEFGSTGKNKQVKNFRDQISKVFSPAQGQTACITRAKATTGFRNMDFTYSPDMIEFIDNIDICDDTPHMKTSDIEELKVLIKICRDVRDTGEVNVNVIP